MFDALDVGVHEMSVEERPKARKAYRYGKSQRQRIGQSLIGARFGFVGRTQNPKRVRQNRERVDAPVIS